MAMDIEQRLVVAIERMPAFPRSVQRLLELTRDINVEPRAIVDVLEKDPVMAGRILRTVNSAFYGLSRKVASLSHAVVLLGLNTVKNMALAIASAGMLPARNGAGFDTAAYLQHSLGVASLARLIAQRSGVDPGEAYAAGLLHDFGKILFCVNLPREFRAALDLAAREGLPLHEAERRGIGVSHAQAGAMLARKWQFPGELADAIAEHHAAGVNPLGILRCLILADQLVRFDDAGELPAGHSVAPLPAGAGGALGSSYAEILAALPERVRIIAESRAFVS